jgi:hypothetical protein
VRITQDWYQFNPQLALHHSQGAAESWLPICATFNLPFIAEFALQPVWQPIDE